MLGDTYAQFPALDISPTEKLYQRNRTITICILLQSNQVCAPQINVVNVVNLVRYEGKKNSGRVLYQYFIGFETRTLCTNVDGEDFTRFL